MRGEEVKHNFTARLLLAATTLTALILCSATAMAACTVSTTPVNFGAYDVFLLTPTDAIGTISVKCTKKKKIKVTVAIGQSPTSGLFTPRQMKNTMSPDLLNYDLYTKKKMTRIWGDGTGGTSVVKKRVPRKRARVFKVYGRIVAGQSVSAGSYFDTLTVTITF